MTLRHAQSDRDQSDVSIYGNFSKGSYLQSMELFDSKISIKDDIELAKNRSIFALFNTPNRANDFSVSAADLYLDYSKQNITKLELDNLISWAKDNNLAQKINAMFSGEKINNTEQRAVLHTVLRAPARIQDKILGTEAIQVQDTDQRMAEIVDGVQQGKLLSETGQKFTDVLAVGIGGSYYGIKVGLSALQPYHSTGLKVHVLANVDGAAVTEKLQQLDAATTLVIIISKTFTTQETLLNAKAIKQWMLAKLNNSAITKQWFAISSNVEKAQAFGLDADHVLPMWD